ncbi:MAG: serine/threonine-protein kinase [Nannocystaceae bacterium]|nr:serine/threonine protein kinase [bacterium]
MADDLQPILGRLKVADQDADAQLAQNAVRARLFGGKAKKTRLGKYALGKLIGAGGMGKVYVAHDRELDRKVALKLLKGEAWTLADGEEGRLRREARTLAQISHPNVVPVYEVGEADMGVFVAMEYIEGRTLRAWVNDEDPSVEQVLHALREAGRGLEAVHAAGIVHRDFKPDNVLIGRDGRICVVDFGLAHEVSAVKVERVRFDTETGRTAMLTSSPAGTPAYMSPERLDGRDADVAGDIYAFCVSTWEALTGQLRSPYLQGLPPDPKRVVPRGIRRMVERGLAFAPAARPSSMREVLATFDRHLNTPRWFRWVPLGAGVLAAGLGVGVLLQQPRDAPSRAVARLELRTPAVLQRPLSERLMTEPDPRGLRFIGRDPPRTALSPPEFASMAFAARGDGVRVVADGLGGRPSRTSAWQDAATDYLDGMRAWAATTGATDFPADIIGLHLEMLDGVSMTGLRPESAHLDDAIAHVAAWRDRHAPGREVWVTRFGYDTHPDSPLRPPAVPGVAADVVHAQWTLRGALALLAGGADRVAVGMAADAGSDAGTGHTSGLRGPPPGLDPKPALHFVETLRGALGEFVLEGPLSGLPEGVHGSRLSHPGGRIAVVAWLGSADGSTRRVPLSLTAATEVRVIPLGDVEQRVPAGPVVLRVSETPVVAIWGG